MKRWNGWGLLRTDKPVPDTALRFLAQRLGQGSTAPDATLEQVVASVPEGSLPDHPLVDTDPEVRVRSARGQSLPDWIALRSGRIPAFPDGVARTRTTEEVRTLLSWASEQDITLVPRGGGTSVVGHANVEADDRPVLVVDMGAMGRQRHLDDTSRLATFEAGVTGPALEGALRSRGYTLGHFPQSWELSTLGGWVVTRSSGQQSYHYGRIEDLFAGGTVELLDGTLELPPRPASAAGPDLRQLVLGSEGRLGILTQATVRISPQPQEERFYGVFFPTWADGVAALRQAAHERLPVSMLRLSTPEETVTTLELAGKERLVSLARRGLDALGFREGRCLMLFGLTGSRGAVRSGLSAARSLFGSHGGLPPVGLLGRTWEHSRFTAPYMRNGLWEAGLALDTFETATTWERIPAMAEAGVTAVRHAAAALDLRVLAFAHLSHVYTDGASVYTTYLYPRSGDPELDLERWRQLKEAASRAIVQHGGTISHQHGVGVDHAPWLQAETSARGRELMGAALAEADPRGLLNPGKLLREA